MLPYFSLASHCAESAAPSHHHPVCPRHDASMVPVSSPSRRVWDPGGDNTTDNNTVGTPLFPDIRPLQFDTPIPSIHFQHSDQSLAQETVIARPLTLSVSTQRAADGIDSHLARINL